jgi:SPP1 family predicted phage head-tail adaptor
VRAGELVHRVSIETPAERSDGHDGSEVTWSPVRRRIAARVTPLSGRELERARQIDPRATHEVRVRYWKAAVVEFTARERLVYHDTFNRVLELVEPPREVEPRVLLAAICREAT